MNRIAASSLAIASLFIVSSASAQTVITQARALAGGITPGDTAGFPITLSQPGAYRFESNLTVPSGNYGLLVTNLNVDIDMNGFTLTGGGVGAYGVVVSAGEGRIHGGSITNFRYYGMYIRANNWTIEDMKVVRNGNNGIDATGTAYTTVRNSTIFANQANGIVIGDAGRIERSVVSQNRANGINCFDGCYIEGNTIKRNGGEGARVTGAVLIGNIVTSNTKDGIFDDTSTAGSGTAHNMLVFNDSNSSDSFQANGLGTFNPNRCVGKTC